MQLLNSQSNQHWQEILNDILKGTNQDVNSFQEDVVDWCLTPERDPQISKDRLKSMGKYLGDILKEWSEKNEKHIDNFEIVETEISQDETECKGYQINVICQNTSFELSERSQGLQWSFCFHVLTKIRKNRYKEGVIFLLDEPANNLHLRPQSKMLEHLKGLCDDKTSVIYSTHSPGLIYTDPESYQTLFVCKNAANEFENNMISLLALKNSKLTIQDVYPILMNLAFEEIKDIGANSETKTEKELWENILKEMKKSSKKTKEFPSCGNLKEVSKLRYFLESVIVNVFGNVVVMGIKKILGN